MKPTAEREAPDSCLASFVEGLFASAAVDSNVDAEAWDRCLLGPALDFLRRPSKRFRSRLAESFWLLFGGVPEQLPMELPALIELIHAGSLIVDDIQDGSTSRRGGPSLHTMIGTGPAINTGNWLYFVGLSLISRLRLGPLAAGRTFEEVNAAMMRCHQGQALDLGIRVFDTPKATIQATAAEITALKTGALAELCGVLPGIAAGADSARIEAARSFCRELGIGLQMLDDIGSIRTRRDKGLEDLRAARLTWAWAWLAETALDVDYGRAVRLARDVHNGADAMELFGLLDKTSEHGAERARRHLGRARARLFEEFGSTPASSDIASEIERLERSYG